MDRYIVRDNIIGTSKTLDILEIKRGDILNDDKVELKYKISVEEPDRSNDIVKVSGIDIKNYINNPIVLFNHDTTKPIGMGKDIYSENGVLYGTIQFHGETQLSREIAALASKGYLKAVSIGFIPLEYKDYNITDDLRKEYKFYPYTDTTRIYTKSEMLEFSIVAIPANASALVTNSFDFSELNLEDNISPEHDMYEIIYTEEKAEKEDMNDMTTIEKAGKVLNKGNLEKLIMAQELIQSVLDSMGPKDEPSSEEESIDENKSLEVVVENDINQTIEYDETYEDILLQKVFKK
jgi:hypothetical protein